MRCAKGVRFIYLQVPDGKLNPDKRITLIYSFCFVDCAPGLTAVVTRVFRHVRQGRSYPSSEIHGHPVPGSYTGTVTDKNLGIVLRVGDLVKVSQGQSESFSKRDLGTHKRKKLNSWVVPSVSGKLIYDPLNYKFSIHSELTR